MITILTPTYNRAYRLPDLYESLKKQNGLFEWLIIDDGSIDETASWVKSISEHASFNIRYIYQENQGKHIALNNGVANAFGDWIFIVDSDDYLCDHAIEIMTKDILEYGATYELCYRKTLVTGQMVMTKKQYIKQKSLRICSVGRLVEFKQYNLWMIDVVNQLRNLGVDITYDIYGTGPLEKKIRDKINDYQLDDIVCLKGNLEYNYFNKIVSTYDLFVGSGTAIIQASALGVISIIGIESEKNALTYGLFSDFYQYEYHRDNPELEKKSVMELINHFFALPVNDKNRVSTEHIQASKNFEMSKCSQFFDNKYIAMESNIIQYSLVKYMISDFYFWLKRKLKHIDIYN